MSQPIELTPELVIALKDPSRMPASVTVKGSSYTLDSPKSEGFKAVVWKAQDDIGRLRALKFAVYEDYEDRSYLQELSRASALDKYEDFARFIDAGIVNIDFGKDDQKVFVCFVEEWIEGTSLKDLLAKGGDRVTPTFMLGYIRAMCNALSELYFERLRHDDLHTGNVMIVEAPQAHISPELRIKIVDNGSMKPSEIPTKKQRSQSFIGEHALAGLFSPRSIRWWRAERVLPVGGGTAPAA
jgi:serine/threonine protein kinase